MISQVTNTSLPGLIFSLNAVVVVVPPAKFLSKLEIGRHCRPPSHISQPVLPLDCASYSATLKQTLILYFPFKLLFFICPVSLCCFKTTDPADFFFCQYFTVFHPSSTHAFVPWVQCCSVWNHCQSESLSQRILLLWFSSVSEIWVNIRMVYI